MKKEVRIGLLAIVTLVSLIVGYQYLRGKNIFKKNYTFYTIYHNVNQLEVASSVKYNGMTIGSVQKLEFNPKDLNTVIVTMDVNDQVRFPKNTRAILSSGKIVGGKEILLVFDKPCGGDDCVESGYTFEGEERGFVESMIGVDNISNYKQYVKESAIGAYDTISQTLQGNGDDKSLLEIKASIHNLEVITSDLSHLLRKSSNDLAQTFSNLAQVTDAMADNQGDLQNTIANFSILSQQLKDAHIDQAISKSAKLMDNANNAVVSLDETMAKSDASIEKLTEILTKMNEGEGTMAKLINDKSFYDNIQKTTTELALLLQDLRLNPNRYVKVSVFGGKSADYTSPEDDPAKKD